MIASVELQSICKILLSEDETEVNTLCGFDESYYNVFRDHILFILEHRDKYNVVPDKFTFLTKFPDFTFVQVNEPLEYLTDGLNKNKQRNLLLETFNHIKAFGTEDVSEAWEYLNKQCELASELDNTKPLDVIKQAEFRSQQVLDYSKQQRIPTGFPEIDKCMYGGFSTVEELVIMIARTNTGKSWVGTKMMETAQKNGFPVMYYSPEMQASFLGTRFDTWRNHFKNSELHQGKYSTEYNTYIKELKNENTSAYILEDKDVSGGEVNVVVLKKLVKELKIKLLIIDGLSYLADVNKAAKDYEKYKNLCADLFQLSKQYGCAVVVMMQANRASKDNKDAKGEVFPNIFNAEGSDHPARIATQVFAMRQIFDKHILDIRLEKSRNANNQKPEFSYAWDINTGNMRFIPNAEADAPTTVAPTVTPTGITKVTPPTTDILNDDMDDEDLEF